MESYKLGAVIRWELCSSAPQGLGIIVSPWTITNTLTIQWSRSPACGSQPFTSKVNRVVAVDTRIELGPLEQEFPNMADDEVCTWGHLRAISVGGRVENLKNKSNLFSFGKIPASFNSYPEESGKCQTLEVNPSTKKEGQWGCCPSQSFLGHVYMTELLRHRGVGLG